MDRFLPCPLCSVGDLCEACADRMRTYSRVLAEAMHPVAAYKPDADSWYHPSTEGCLMRSAHREREGAA